MPHEFTKLGSMTGAPKLAVSETRFVCLKTLPPKTGGGGTMLTKSTCLSPHAAISVVSPTTANESRSDHDPRNLTVPPVELRGSIFRGSNRESSRHARCEASPVGSTTTFGRCTLQL